MARIIFADHLVRQAFAAAKRILVEARYLRSRGEPVPFDRLRDGMDALRRDFAVGIAPILGTGGTAAQINAVIKQQAIGALPGSPVAQFQALQAALGALNAAYASLHDGLTHSLYDPAEGHSYPLVPLAQLATLAAPLDGVIAAADPIAPDDQV